MLVRVCITRNVNFVIKKKQHLMFIPVLVVSNYDCISDKCLTDFSMMAYIMAITI